MTDSERRAIEQDCLKLIAVYALAADHHDAERFVGIFAPDAQWIRPTGAVIQGHDALRAFMLQRPRSVLSRHVSTNAVVDVLGPDTAHGISYATVYKHEGHEGGSAPLGGPESIVEYHDDFIRTQAGWRIVTRRAHSIFRGA
jgi:uncharacterized protein (TIGR02246 family)